MTSSTTDLLGSIREQNLGVYRAMPSRVREDVGQESQIAQDYRGRLTYELLQNADDAMVGQAGFGERIRFTLTDDALTVANSGRPLSDEDVAGLCGIGSTTKTDPVGGRRASIGHKGMGFKSVLEITDRPEVYSTTHSFRLDARMAAPEIGRALTSVQANEPIRVPTMRLPWPSEGGMSAQNSTDGFNTEFVFPLRDSLTAEHRDLLAQRLLELPVTSILFLKHLEDVEVTVDTSRKRGHFRWKLERETRTDGRWLPSPGFVDSAVYRIQISSDDGSRWGFLVAHDADVEIGAHRGGLDDSSWADIALTEVSLAVPWRDRGNAPLPAGWAKLHVFLPTQEISPYPILVNGAFRTDLSRQEIRVGDGESDYNRFLLGAAARVFRDRLLPVLDDEGVDAVEILGLLDRSVTHASREAGTAATVLHQAMAADLAPAPFLRGEAGITFSISECVVPPPGSDPLLGTRFRSVLAGDATLEDRWFPAPDLCAAKPASILVDLGAAVLRPEQAASVLAGCDPTRSQLQPHESAGDRLSVDPVLSILEGLWSEYRGKERTALETSARAEALFPVAVDDEGYVRRVATKGLQCFYPPRSLTGEVPLSGLQFMLQSICWGDLRPAERRLHLGGRLPIWQGLFDVREFKFPDVMRASVLPALELDPSPDTLALRASLKDVDQVAAICQLAGRSANPGTPLPFERLGSNRALFNLSRLQVPCRPVKEGIPLWQPAYKVYFGRDWIEESSVETVLDAVKNAGGTAPNVPILASFDEFKGHLDQYRHLQAVADEAEDDSEVPDADEVGVDEDEEAALESDERERWIAFLTWLGVNRSLRPVSFQDVEDRGAGWLSTAGLSEPQGHAFRDLGIAWATYSENLRAGLTGTGDAQSTAYFYRLHDLDAIGDLLGAASRDETTTISRALYEHLAGHWAYLAKFSRVQLAVVPDDRSPGKRTAPPKPLEDELREVGDDFWVSRLRRAPWVPSTHGPRPPGAVWLESSEVDRRFGRRGSVAGDLLPLLDAKPEAWRGKSAGLATAIGVREELTPGTFGEDDARSLIARLESLFGGEDAPRPIDERGLREVIRPAYRNLIELLSGASPDDEDDDGSVAPTLGDARILVHDGQGDFDFIAARDTVYVSRSGTRERLGGARIQSFIIESSITARRPLRMLGIRTLEDVLDWTPDPGPAALDETELNRFHTGLSNLAPYLLARLRADRADDRLATRDASRLRTLLGCIEPVESLRIRCELDGRPLLESGGRNAFFGVPAGKSVQAFVRWGEHGWPPTRDEADALATVLVDAIGAGAYEAFVALVQAETDEARMRLLRLVGAPTDLQEIRALLAGSDTGTEPGEPPTATSTTEAGRTTVAGAEEWVVTPKPMSSPGSTGATIPLYGPGDLLIDGVPIVVVGAPTGDDGGSDGHGAPGGGSRDGGHRGYGSIATDLTELDRVGMWVALTFERHRLRLRGHPSAEIFVAGQSPEHAYVFDVSSSSAIERAGEGSNEFKRAFDVLLKRGIRGDFPGFDILTLDPAGDEREARLIELKSSGVNARVQSMSWNEWKTARDSELRERFYLYLVSNLRRDLGDAKPYLRAIQDPFGSLWGQEVKESSVKRTIQLNVSEFTSAEELVLGVSESEAGELAQ